MEVVQDASMKDVLNQPDHLLHFVQPMEVDQDDSIKDSLNQQYHQLHFVQHMEEDIDELDVHGAVFPKHAVPPHGWPLFGTFRA